MGGRVAKLLFETEEEHSSADVSPKSHEPINIMQEDGHIPTVFRLNVDTAMYSIINEVFGDSVSVIQRVPVFETIVGPSGDVQCEFDGLYYLPERGMFIAGKAMYQVTALAIKLVENDARRLYEAMTQMCNTHQFKSCISYEMQRVALMYLRDVDKKKRDDEEEKRDIKVGFCVCYKHQSLTDEEFQKHELVAVRPRDNDGYCCALSMSHFMANDEDCSIVDRNELMADNFLAS